MEDDLVEHRTQEAAKHEQRHLPEQMTNTSFHLWR